MTDQEIIKLAILKAEENGYIGHTEYMPLFLKRGPEKADKFSKEELLDMMSKVWLRQKNDIIFSRSFAQAFWGWEETCLYCGEHFMKSCKLPSHPVIGTAWKYHLQQLVLEKQPLKYLEKFLEEK